MTGHPDPERAHVGVVLPTREALRLGAAVVADFGAAAEALGFDSVWAGDSLLARPLLDPLIALAAVAARTSSIRLGTGVLLAPLHQPVLAARAIASVDQLSHGRLVLGVGRGLDLPETRREFAAAGAEFASRTRRWEQVIALWRQLWSEPAEPVTSAGASWTLDAVEFSPRPVQPGGPPIWIAGYGARAFRRTAALGDGWLPYPPTADLYRDGWEHLAAHAREVGRSSPIVPAVMITLAVDESTARAQEQLDRYVETFYGYPRDIVGLLQAMHAGRAADTVAFLRSYWDAGARAFVLRLAALDTPSEQLRRVAQAVLSELRSWSASAATAPGTSAEPVPTGGSS